MPTVASARQPSTVQSPTSSRSSLSLDHQNLPQGGTRRNRLALRDYYGIKAASAAESPTSAVSEDLSPLAELDKPSFDAAAYVSGVLADDSLESLLKVEAGLIGEIRGLDGERKALVYDNYSKLIAATDTIRRMRTNMDPLVPMTMTLEPAMAHIALTASQLGENLRNKSQLSAEETKVVPSTQSKAQTVRWVLGSPQRLADLMMDGKREEAEVDWAEVQVVLRKWDGVDGVEEVRQKAQAIMAS